MIPKVWILWPHVAPTSFARYPIMQRLSYTQENIKYTAGYSDLRSKCSNNRPAGLSMLPKSTHQGELRPSIKSPGKLQRAKHVELKMFLLFTPRALICGLTMRKIKCPKTPDSRRCSFLQVAFVGEDASTLRHSGGYRLLGATPGGKPGWR